MHRDVGLRTKILDDHFLDVTIALLQVPYSTQSIDAFTKCLADTNEDPGGKREVYFAGIFNGFQADSRVFVGCIIMRHALAKQTAAGGLEHDAHARAYLA